MVEFVPSFLYTPTFLLCTAILTLYYCNNLSSGVTFQKKGTYGVMMLYAVFMIILMGSRPINGRLFGDTPTYAAIFDMLTNTSVSTIEIGDGEWVWHIFTWVCAQMMEVNTYFTIVAFFYIIPLVIACRRLSPSNPAVMLLFAMSAYSFFSYGTNGIRNGMACSFIILALSFMNDGNTRGKVIAVFLAFLAFFCHKSTALPSLCMIVCLYHKNTKNAIFFWIASIGISLVAGGAVENFFSGLGFDDRMTDYGSANIDAELFSSTGFRWDFLLYSAMPIVLGYYIVFKRSIKHDMYSYLLNSYILCNAFWVMMIRASYSNRFAYLSWFLYPIVLAYPLLNFQVFKTKNNQKVAMILMAHSVFTIFMSLIGK